MQSVREFLHMQKLGKHPLSTESGATGMGKWAQAFGGTGLLEMNIGRSGISMQLGMGGIDVGGALYDLGKRSYDRSMLQRYEREHGKDKGETAYSAYVIGHRSILRQDLRAEKMNCILPKGKSIRQRRAATARAADV